MKKILAILVLLLSLLSCAKAQSYTTPFETGGKIYKVALLPWKASTMNFTFKYRWTITQALRDACKQAVAFELDWSAYPVNGGNVEILEKVDGPSLWERKKYGRYEPDTKKVLPILNAIGADLGLLYNISADNAVASDSDSMGSRDDYIRLFMVDAKTGQVTVGFLRTNFMRKMGLTDTKRVTLLTFSKWLSQ